MSELTPGSPRFSRQVRQHHRDHLAREAIVETLAALAGDLPDDMGYTYYGPTGEDASGLVIWYVFVDPVALESARDVGLWERLREATLAALARWKYPADSTAHLFVGFTSADELERQGTQWIRA